MKLDDLTADELVAYLVRSWDWSHRHCCSRQVARKLRHDHRKVVDRLRVRVDRRLKAD